eukprot:3256766-Rhodomonas_salina.1
MIRLRLWRSELDSGPLRRIPSAQRSPAAPQRGAEQTSSATQSLPAPPPAGVRGSGSRARMHRHRHRHRHHGLVMSSS